MNAFALKLRLLVLLIFGCSFFVKGQNFRFIYIQTENKQPFYVKMDRKYLNSSASGYIIVAKLTEGAYKLVIGSLVNEWTELTVTLIVKDVNTGYLLKRSADKNWGLVNLQTQALMTAEKKPPPAKITETISEGDAFAKMLAEVVNDPSIGQVITVKNETEPMVVTTADKTTVTPEVKLPANAELSKPLEKVVAVSRLAHDSTGSGLLLTYMDKSGLVNDTVKLFIPVTESAATVPKEKKETVETKPRFIDLELQNPGVKTDSGVLKKTDMVITQKKTGLSSSSKTTEPGRKADVLKAPRGGTNPNCKKEATQNDFLRLRKQMAAADSEREMTKTAGRQFSLTCFTTEQIRNLGLLFITEDEKYKFYVASFPYIEDMQNFGALEDQLSDIYYKTRFKAMLSNKNILKD